VTLLEDVAQMKTAIKAVQEVAEESKRILSLQGEQLNGERGIQATINHLAKEIQGLRRAAYWLAALIVTSSIGFAFSVLTLLQ
jgi:23S rRNA A1618 N6-methylase RlmF